MSDHNTESFFDLKEEWIPRRKGSDYRQGLDALRLARIGYWIWHLSQDTFFWSDEMYLIFEMSPKCNLDSKKSCECIIHPEDLASYRKFREGVLSSESKSEIRYRIVRPDGQTRHIIERAALYWDDAGSAYMQGTVQDISEFALPEERLKSELAKQEQLRQEILHRVKNNLHSLSSLLSSYETESSDNETREILSEAIGSIQGMGALYELLTFSKDGKALSGHLYLQKLAEAIASSFPQRTRPRIVTDSDEIAIGAKQLFLIGLVVNELVMNSVKHAAPGKAAGQIILSLKQAGKQGVLVFHDCASVNVDCAAMLNSDGFGMQVIVNLIKQIPGIMEVDNKNGLRFEINFAPE